MSDRPIIDPALIEKQLLRILRYEKQLLRILRYADLRKHLADDEHRDPLPIYGAARWFDRVPVALLIPDGKERLLDARNNMTYADHLCMDDRRTNPEEGC